MKPTAAAILFFILFLTGKPLFAESNSGIIPFVKVEFGTLPASAESVGFPVIHNKNNYDLLIRPTVILHHDSVHHVNFKYKDKKRGIKPFIAPTLLIATGTALHFSTEAKENFQDWVQENTSYSGHVEDYLEYAPLAVVYGLNALGVKGKNNFGNRTAIVIKSLLLNDLIVSSLKTWVGEERPNGGSRSFPSGHTSVAFALAQFMHHEYGDKSVWYSVGAYSCATAVGMLRVVGNAHWISDVVAGAGFGMMSTELVYLTHQYKWDKEHLRNFDIFPWTNKKQIGLTMVYTF
jgi:membrane-associated phospholipid phosphatase